MRVRPGMSCNPKHKTELLWDEKEVYVTTVRAGRDQTKIFGVVDAAAHEVRLSPEHIP